MDAGGRATQGAVAEGQGEGNGNELNAIDPPHPNPLPEGEGAAWVVYSGLRWKVKAAGEYGNDFGITTNDFNSTRRVQHV